MGTWLASISLIVEGAIYAVSNPGEAIAGIVTVGAIIIGAFTF